MVPKYKVSNPNIPFKKGDYVIYTKVEPNQIGKIVHFTKYTTSTGNVDYDIHIQLPHHTYYDSKSVNFHDIVRL
tara:strand:- start:1140 stop:1361 length:222 start_codon:yes stop_codon:yes gene_type:complete